MRVLVFMRLERKPTAAADLVAVIAMVLAILAIVWARIELYGTGDIEDALSGETTSVAAACNSKQAEALTRNRWATGFSH